MVAASELYTLVSPPGVSRINKASGCCYHSGAFLFLPHNGIDRDAARRQQGEVWRAHAENPPGDRLPSESTGVDSHKKPSPVDAVGADARPGICHRSSPGRRRVFFGGLATDVLAPFAKGSPRLGGTHASPASPFAKQMLRICSTPQVRNDLQNNPAQAGNAEG